MNCDSYDGCVKQGKNVLRYPVDTKSLYSQRIYDNQTANKKCYQRHPIEIIEGFGNMNLNTF